MVLKFLSKKHETGNIWSFFFEPQEDVEWLAGQYLNLTMPDVPPVYADRLFTIASAPYEKHIQITTFIGESPFKQKLSSLEVGAVVEADQVGGDFTLHPDHTPAILASKTEQSSTPKSVIPAQAGISKRLFLAGGLGITPFRSMIVQTFHQDELLRAVLFWSGSDEQCPFINVLEAFAAKDPTLDIERFTNERITAEKIKALIADLDERVIYLAGSQEFVESLGDGLMSQGISRAQLKYDWFDGYTGTLV